MIKVKGAIDARTGQLQYMGDVLKAAADQERDENGRFASGGGSGKDDGKTMPKDKKDYNSRRSAMEKEQAKHPKGSAEHQAVQERIDNLDETWQQR